MWLTGSRARSAAIPAFSRVPESCARLCTPSAVCAPCKPARTLAGTSCKPRGARWSVRITCAVGAGTLTWRVGDRRGSLSLKLSSPIVGTSIIDNRSRTRPGCRGHFVRFRLHPILSALLRRLIRPLQTHARPRLRIYPLPHNVTSRRAARCCCRTDYVYHHVQPTARHPSKAVHAHPPWRSSSTHRLSMAHGALPASACVPSRTLLALSLPPPAPTPRLAAAVAPISLSHPHPLPPRP